ncbi:MAG: DUF2194 domain-containing protein [Anaerolineae bacterium]|nr:DUF2194 domain-containing protein [Anaerolineae bacterium]
MDNTGGKFGKRLRNWGARLKKRLIFERDWLIDLSGAIRGGLAIRKILAGLFSWPGRFWNWLKISMWRMRHRPPTEAGRKPRPAWAWHILSLAALGILFLVIYFVIPQRTSFESFTIFTTAPQQRILLVHHSADPNGQVAYLNARQSLDYARLEYETLDLAEGGNWPDLSRYSALFLVTELLDGIDQAQAGQITNYVADGGGLAVLYRGWNPHLVSLFGLEVEAGKQPQLVEDEWGLEFATDFFPGVEALFLDRSIAPNHTPYRVQVQPEAKIMARAVPQPDAEIGRPIVWLNRYQQGRVLFWNTTLLSAKNMRGFIVQSLANVQGLSVLPVANFAAIQIDDFPGPFPTAKMEPIKTEYDMTPVEFYYQVWYPDLMQIARRYDLVYTFLSSFANNDQTQPPFEFADWERATIDMDGHNLFYSRHAAHLALQQGELGFRGYNRIPLITENWSGQENIIAALQAAAERWDADSLGRRPLTYSPPEGGYDETGAKALTKALPSLKVISGLYEGDFAHGGDREFGPEPWNPNLLNIPRVTTGYNLTASQRLAMLSELGMMGVWTHNIRPDDVFDTPENYPTAPALRNPGGWNWRDDEGAKDGLYYRFLRWLNLAHTYYPWLRYVRVEEAYEIAQTYLANQITVNLKPYSVSLESTAPTYFQIRINDGRRVDLNALQGAQFIHLYNGDGYTVYTMRGLGQTVQLQLLLPEVQVYKE